MAVLDELVAILGFDLRGENQARRYQAALDNMDRGLTNVSNRALSVGRVLTGLFVALGTARVIDGAVSFEEAMADVNKVVDATSAQMDALSDTMLRMSRELPVSAEGLASIAAEAGATGVALEDLEAFTRQVAVAVTAFDLPAERVGEVMAKLGNAFAFNVEQMGMFNDTVNHLSNNMAAKAGELLNFTNRAAGAARLLGVTADQLAGIGAALIAAGVVPETAARGLNALATRVQTDAKGVNEALQSVGLTTTEMQRMLAEDGDGALIQLFESLSELDVSKQAVALKALVGQDFSDDFSKLTNNPDLLAQALGLANDEAGKLGSAQREYNTRAETTRAKWQRTKGIMASVGIIAAGPLLDGFGRVADKVFEITEAIDNAETNAEALQAVAGAMGFDLTAEQAQALVDTLTAGFEAAGAAVGAIRDALGQSLAFVAGEYVPAMLAHWDRIVAAFGSLDLSGWIDLVTQMGLVDTATGAMAAGVSAAMAVFNSLSELAATALEVVLAGLSDLSEDSVISGLVERLSGLGEAVTAVFDKLSVLFGPGGAGEGLATTLGTIVGALTVLFVEIIGNKLVTIAELVVTAIDTIINVINKLIEGDIIGAVSALFDGLASMAQTLGTYILTIAQSVGDLIERVTGIDLSEIFSNLLQSAKDAAIAIKDAFFEIMSNLGDYLKNAILSGVEAALNYAVAKINAMVDGLNVALGYVGGEIDRLEMFNLTDDGGNAPTEARDSVHRSTLARQDAIDVTVDLTPLASAVDNLVAASAATVDIGENASRLVEQTTNTDNTRNITNQITNNTTVNQTVTGPTAASSAATATQRAAQRGTDRGLTVSNQGPQ